MFIARSAAATAHRLGARRLGAASLASVSQQATRGIELFRLGRASEAFVALSEAVQQGGDDFAERLGDLNTHKSA